MTPNLRQATSQGMRPEPSDRRHMVRAIVDSIRQVCLNPTCKQCTDIAKSIIKKYPDSFADKTEEGDFLGGGYHSLLEQIKTRADHLNRNNTLARVKRETDI